MEIRPEEITSVLKDKIENFGHEAHLEEAGRVLNVGDGNAVELVDKQRR